MTPSASKFGRTSGVISIVLGLISINGLFFFFGPIGIVSAIFAIHNGSKALGWIGFVISSISALMFLGALMLGLGMRNVFS